MGELDVRHEREFAEALECVGVKQTISSGRARERLDADTARDGSLWRFVYSLKCTTGKGLRVTTEMFTEAHDRAYERSAECRPAMGLRIYGNSSGKSVGLDAVLVDLHDWRELLLELADLRRAVGDSNGAVRTETRV